MAQDSELLAFRAWCVKTGNYAAVETVDRWLKMSTKQREKVLQDLERRKK
jgi:hypothetical protein